MSTVARAAGLLLLVAAVGFGATHLYAPERTLDLTPVSETVPAKVGGDGRTAVGRSAARAGTQSVDQAWLADTAALTGIPVPALRAYANAQISGVAGCNVGWTTLAGIGWVESQHGTIGGRTLDADGRSSTPIIGPALDGTDGFAAIHSDAESQAWHGDTTWEHAVGPMQFLRSSWDPWATDGDGDGVADPLDIDDAAATAARYLCASGQDLDSSAAWTAAVYSYNHSDEYVAQVNAAALEYAERAAG
ncbi:lytic murein transglycosylase [Nocardioides sp. GY 10127]|uniref:lytic murein transglycosylase n=1 Tax=Nocardioides sp. GY 10127 TaxID=2569762 RepID=UPI0010A8D712|nr:lytic murein transglycosylase [Nocardioides sp. GY 10127]TIC84359.1 lytic murein transglycosylase [Nocardioides sp. GY 10127]